MTRTQTHRTTCQHELGTEFTPYYYRARYYDPAAGRFISEDPLRFAAEVDFYRYARNNVSAQADPTGLFTLEGFPPARAAEMTTAIGSLQAKLKQNPCCAGSRGNKLLDLVQPGSYGSGVTFVYRKSLPAAPGKVTCGRAGDGTVLGNNWSFWISHRVEISEAAFTDPACGCLASTLLHEVNHLTWSNRSSQDIESDSRDLELKCFGVACSGQ